MKTRTPKNVAERYRADNIEAAKIIATDPLKYPGLMQEWAQRVLAPNPNRAEEFIGRPA